MHAGDRSRVALAAGLYLVVRAGRDRADGCSAAGAFFVLFYTFPLKYIGMGEARGADRLGPAHGGRWLLRDHRASGATTWRSPASPTRSHPTAVLFGKHIDKLDADQDKGIRTLPVILGERVSRYAVVGMLIAQFVVVGYLVATGYFGWPVLLCLAAAPSLRRVFSVYAQPRPSEAPPELPDGVWPLWFVAAAFWYTRRFGLFFVVGLVLDLLIG